VKQSRCVLKVRSIVVLGFVSAFITRTMSAQVPQEQTASSSSSSLAAALFAPMLPDAPGTAGQQAVAATAEKPRHNVETTLSVGGFPQLTATRIENPSSGGFITQSLHPSPGVLIAFRQSYRPWLGYSVNMGYTRASEHNTNNASGGLGATFDNFYVPNNVWELSLTHMAQKQITHQLTGFTEAGAGFLSFQPAKKGSTYFVPSGLCCGASVGNSFRPLVVFGAGADYHFNAQWALRAEYRGLLYKYPNYGLDGVARLITISSEPTVSVTYRFGGGNKEKR
jgi:opacity protein-like surface antigen